MTGDEAANLAGCAVFVLVLVATWVAIIGGGLWLIR